MLLGPLSDTISSVSCRDWALAGDHTAGADIKPDPANAALVFRKSRRFMLALPVLATAKVHASQVPKLLSNIISMLEASVIPGERQIVKLHAVYAHLLGTIAIDHKICNH